MASFKAHPFSIALSRSLKHRSLVSQNSTQETQQTHPVVVMQQQTTAFTTIAHDQDRRIRWAPGKKCTRLTRISFCKNMRNSQLAALRACGRECERLGGFRARVLSQERRRGQGFALTHGPLSSTGTPDPTWCSLL